jgi:hypothetical protein
MTRLGNVSPAAASRHHRWQATRNAFSLSLSLSLSLPLSLGLDVSIDSSSCFRETALVSPPSSKTTAPLGSAAATASAVASDKKPVAGSVAVDCYIRRSRRSVADNDADCLGMHNKGAKQRQARWLSATYPTWTGHPRLLASLSACTGVS